MATGRYGGGYIVDFQLFIQSVHYFISTHINLEILVYFGIFWYNLQFVVFQSVMCSLFVILLFFSLLYFIGFQSIRWFEIFSYLCTIKLIENANTIF